MLNFEHNGHVYTNWEVSEARARGIPANVIGTALKSTAQTEAIVMADALRARVASASAGRLAEWQFKAGIAADPDNADAAELALIDREATARGETRADLLALITAKNTAFRQVALTVGALEAETKEALAAIPIEAPDIEARIELALTTARNAANAALAAALTQINGGA